MIISESKYRPLHYILWPFPYLSGCHINIPRNWCGTLACGRLWLACKVTTNKGNAIIDIWQALNNIWKTVTFNIRQEAVTSFKTVTHMWWHLYNCKDYIQDVLLSNMYMYYFSYLYTTFCLLKMTCRKINLYYGMALWKEHIWFSLTLYFIYLS